MTGSEKPAVLVQAADDEAGSVLNISKVGDDGSFHVKNLPPGEYLLAAIGMHVPPSEAMPSRCGDRAARVKVEGARTSTVHLRLCTPSGEPGAARP
jgi:hypothetical protein